MDANHDLELQCDQCSFLINRQQIEVPDADKRSHCFLSQNLIITFAVYY